VGALGAAVALGAALTITLLNRSADDRRVSQLALAELDRDAQMLHGLTAEAVRSGFTPELRTSLDQYRKRADRTIRTAATSRASDDAVGEALDAALAYQAAATALLTRLQTGASDDGTLAHDVEPRFAQLEQKLSEVYDDAGLAAENATAFARAGTFGVLALAAGLLALLLWHFDRARRAAHEAFYDPLTGLANRALFADRLAHALALATRREEHVAVLFLDLDDFKTVNDSLGHAAGDDLLIAVGERLATQIRATDTIARLGGDEFAFLIEGVDAAGAHRFADRLVDVLGAPFEIAGRRVAVRATVGCALGSPRSSADDLLRDADLAMYAGKRQGKSRVVNYEPSMYEALADRLELEADLQGALARGELSLAYQPIVDVSSGRLLSFEALARWHHPERGTIAPSVFIPLAEANGAIRGIGRWALLEACTQAARWGREHPARAGISVSVNVSPAQFLRDELVEDVASALRSSGLEPERLTLEITESVLVERGETFLDELHALGALGVRLAVDDFGTGYSSLSTLSQYPVDVLKIDRSFVAAMEARPDGEALVRSIVELGSSLGLAAVAEGIEGRDQADMLGTLGCEMAQGYHYARPMTPEDVSRLLAEEPGRPSAPADPPGAPRPRTAPLSPRSVLRPPGRAPEVETPPASEPTTA
jgi:diguanylate cyclase (GGDEF)-like protein